MNNTTQPTHSEHLKQCFESLFIVKESSQQMARKHHELKRSLGLLRNDIDDDEYEETRGCLYCAPGNVVDGDCEHANGGDPRYHDIARLKVALEYQSREMDTIAAAMERMKSTSHRMRRDIQSALEREESAQR